MDSYTGRRIEASGEVPLVEDVRRTLRAERADWDARQTRRRRVEHVLELGPEGGGEDWADWVLRRKRAQYRQGSYLQLEAALEALRETNGRLYVAFVCSWGPPSFDRRVGPRLREAAELAMTFVLDVMPREIRVPQWLTEPRSRDERIRELGARRVSQAEIARQVGVSVSTVGRVLRRPA